MPELTVCVGLRHPLIFPLPSHSAAAAIEAAKMAAAGAAEKRESLTYPAMSMPGAADLLGMSGLLLLFVFSRCAHPFAPVPQSTRPLKELPASVLQIQMPCQSHPSQVIGERVEVKGRSRSVILDHEV